MITKVKDLIFRIVYILMIIYLLIFVPCIWGYKPLVIISESMEPVLKVGGILYYEKTDLNDFEVNDILVYEIKNHIISHRIVDKVDNSFITKGDANNSVDNFLVNESQVLGKGTNWSIPFLGYYADFIYTNKYLLYIAIIVIVVDLLNNLYNSHKKKRGSNNEKS